MCRRDNHAVVTLSGALGAEDGSGVQESGREASRGTNRTAPLDGRGSGNETEITGQMEPCTAKEIYEEMCGVDPLQIRSLKSPGAKHFFQKFSNQISNIVEDIEVSGIHAEAPTPWHAAIFCLLMTSCSTSIEGPIARWGKEEIRDAWVTNSRLIFRGHADSSWEWTMVPKLERPGVDKRAARRAQRLLASLLSDVIPVTSQQKGSVLPPEVFVAVAQHYGIATDLLDFTYDPSVAIYFASHGRKKNEHQRAVVYFLLTPEARKMGMRILLPPPPADRVYVQRGLFLKGTRASLLRLRQTCRRITFPLDESFQVIRENQVVNLLPRSDWLGNLIDHIIVAGEHTDISRKMPSLEKSMFLARWLHYLHDVIQWITIVQSSRNRRFLDVEELRYLTRSNPYLMNWYAVWEVAEHGGLNLRSRKLRQPRTVTSTTKVIQETLASMRIKPLTFELWPELRGG